MAKDVVFESERYEKRQSIKRYLFPALGILVIAAIAIAVTLLLRGRRLTVISGGEDTPYPYVWTVNKNGSVVLEIDHSASPGYVWRQAVSAAGMSVMTEEDSGQSKTRFTLTPTGEERSMLRFVLLKEEDGADRIYELSFLAEAQQSNGKLAATPVSVAGKPLQGKISSDADSLIPYTVRTDMDGDLLIAVALPAQEDDTAGGEEAGTEETENETADADGESDAVSTDWNCDSSDTAVAQPLGVIYGDEEIVAYFRPGSVSGNVTLRMTEHISGAYITVECENSGDSTLRVLAHSVALG